LESHVGRAYPKLHDDNQSFSFFQYAKSDNPQWLFIPLLEEQTESIKPFATMAIDLILRGILSKLTNPSLKTLIVIDELGSINELPSLSKFLTQSRKFEGSAILGTQSEAQVSDIYGAEITRILLQNTFTKLILNCPDPKTSQLMADIIGKQRFEEPKTSVTRDR
jgi:type IV secretory pathway TraG/TraD family ATPase VirD4